MYRVLYIVVLTASVHSYPYNEESKLHKIHFLYDFTSLCELRFPGSFTSSHGFPLLYFSFRWWRCLKHRNHFRKVVCEVDTTHSPEQLQNFPHPKTMYGKMIHPFRNAYDSAKERLYDKRLYGVEARRIDNL